MLQYSHVVYGEPTPYLGLPLGYGVFYLIERAIMSFLIPKWFKAIVEFLNRSCDNCKYKYRSRDKDYPCYECIKYDEFVKWEKE